MTRSQVRNKIPTPQPGSDELSLRALLRHSKQFQSASDEIDNVIGKLRAEKGDAALVKFLFSRKVWNDYDQTMQGHTDVIDYLMGLMIGLNDSPLMRGIRGPFSSNLKMLDVGGGTGEIERIIFRRLGGLGWKRVKDARILDLSEDMVQRAREKFAREGIPMPNGDSSYIFQDLLKDEKLDLQVKPNLVIMSQVLPFIKDTNTREMAVGSPHTKRRLEVVRKLVELMEEGGYFLLIDEDPMMLTIHGNRTSEIVRGKLFNNAIVPIQRTEVIAGIMKNLSERLEFVTELRCPIDNRHGMYAMLYRVKKQTDDELTEIPTDNPELPKMRREATERVLQTLLGLESAKIHGNVPYINVNEGQIRKIISTRQDNGGYRLEGDIAVDNPSCIILENAIMGVGNGTRRKMIGDLIAQVRTGGSIIVVDEWPPRRDALHEITNRNFRDSLMAGEFGGVVTPLASVRLQIDAAHSNAVYGYEYRKI